MASLASRNKVEMVKYLVRRCPATSSHCLEILPSWKNGPSGDFFSVIFWNCIFSFLSFRNVVKLLKDVLRRQPVEDDMDSSDTPLDDDDEDRLSPLSVKKTISNTTSAVRDWLDNNVSSNCSIRYGLGHHSVSPVNIATM